MCGLVVMCNCGYRGGSGGARPGINFGWVLGITMWNPLASKNGRTGAGADCFTWRLVVIVDLMELSSSLLVGIWFALMVLDVDKSHGTTCFSWKTEEGYEFLTC